MHLISSNLGYIIGAMTEKDIPQEHNSEDDSTEKPLFQKGEIHTASTPDTEFVPGVGFVPSQAGASIVVGDEEMVFADLRKRGYSEEAIAAIKNGKIIEVRIEETVFGTLRTEKWEGKDEGQETKENED